jgi:molybdenum cofactor biosynthesis enzyme MoaA
MQLKDFYRDSYYLEKVDGLLEELLPTVTSKGLNLQVIQELLPKPYLPSSELCKALGLTKEELRKTYSFIRSSEPAKELFSFTPYPYLLDTLQRLSKHGKRTLRILRGVERLTPETLELFISQSCNAKCKFCYRNGHLYDQETTVLSTPEYVRLIHEFADMQGQHLDVSGGLEPLLSPSLLDILQTGITRNLQVSLYTNGIALDNADIIKQAVKIHKIRVSLNAVDRKGYREIMGVDQFNHVIDNVKTLVDVKRKSKSNVMVGAGFVVFHQNYTSIPAALTLAQELELDFLDLRVVEATTMRDFNEAHLAELSSILTEVRQKTLRNEYGAMIVSIADTFNEIVATQSDYMKYIKKDLVNALPHFRITVTPHGRVYALNVIGQPSREDQRYLVGTISSTSDLSSILGNKMNVPYEQNLLLAHDITMLVALSKLAADLEFGISLEDNPFNWK